MLTSQAFYRLSQVHAGYLVLVPPFGHHTINPQIAAARTTTTAMASVIVMS